MIAKELFDKISIYIQDAVNSRDSSSMVDRIKMLGLQTEGEVNYAHLKCSYVAKDGSSIKFSFRSYDPSGPFQNIPDVNIIQLQLCQNDTVLTEINERFDDKSIYGA